MRGGAEQESGLATTKRRRSTFDIEGTRSGAAGSAWSGRIGREPSLGRPGSFLLWRSRSWRDQRARRLQAALRHEINFAGDSALMRLAWL